MWPIRIDERARARLPEQARAEVDKAPVPLLVVDDVGLLRKAVITTGPHWAALSCRHDGITVSLHGTRLSHDYRDIPPAEGTARVRGQAAFITQNEGIWSASWPEHGVAYSLEVECERASDARCRDEHELLELAERLVYVGGEGSRR
jgi:hypothetical protein